LLLVYFANFHDLFQNKDYKTFFGKPNTMFTGLIEQQGIVDATWDLPGGRGLRLLCSTSQDWADIALGESIALNGACMTVTQYEPRGDKHVSFDVEVSAESLNVTTLGGFTVGQHINLERAMLPTTRLGGHFVTGHVDGLVRLVAIEPDGMGHGLTFELTPPMAQWASCILPKGSVALNGISLTVNTVAYDKDSLEATRFTVMIIPHTWTHTTLSQCQVGDLLNIEVDMLVKAIQRQLALIQA
jgi:riboflavin synthase